MKKQTGFTLIELMISLVVGLIIVAATISIYVATTKSSSDTIKAARLNHDLESVMGIMVNDIRRAGYWGGAIAGSDGRNNPFTANATNIQLRNLAAPTATVTTGNCILYTYDGGSGITGGVYHDANGLVDADEYYGFRRNGNTINMRLSGSATDPADCNNNADSWEENIAGDQITITGLTFNMDSSKCFNVSTATPFNSTCAVAAATPGNLNSGNTIVETRQVTITLAGQLADDPNVKKTLTNIVKIRNDRIFTQP